ncbi:MAG TPA: hypothetical protein EYP17_05695 [Candidatus Latescibacteria bacterium]|nr:hypothetical protein [Candidatus Latescibacterota bacterium]
MKAWRILMYVAGIVALVSLIIGIISRLAMAPIAGLEANAFLRFTNTCLLFAVNFGLLQLLQAKKG